ncbi:MAG: hypothetical protein AB1305_05315 [Candidatus Hadarchaeota archaeon]
MERRVLKFLRDFAEKELEKKRASRVIVRRAKMKSVMKRGRVPDFRVRTVEGAKYLVCVFAKEDITIYFFDGTGASLGAAELSGKEAEEEWSKISKSTGAVFSLF